VTHYSGAQSLASFSAACSHRSSRVHQVVEEHKVDGLVAVGREEDDLDAEKGDQSDEERERAEGEEDGWGVAVRRAVESRSHAGGVHAVLAAVLDRGGGVSECLEVFEVHVLSCTGSSPSGR